MKQSDKPIKYVMTATFDDHYGSIESIAYLHLAKHLWKKYPVDMLVFEYDKTGKILIKAHGYHADTNKFINKYIYSTMSMEIKNFWLKYDDYGDYWVGTFLFPDEY